MGQNASNMANWPVYRRQPSRVRKLVSADFESRPVDVSACTYRLAPTAPTADSNLESAEYRRLKEIGTSQTSKYVFGVFTYLSYRFHTHMNNRGA